MWEVTLRDGGLESETVDIEKVPELGDIIEKCMEIIQIVSLDAESKMAVVEIQYF